MRRFTTWVAVLCTFGWTSVPVLAVDADASSSGNIFGLALGDGGNPLANTPVELIDSSGKVLQKAATDATGNYGFPCVPNGNYTIGLGSGDGETRRLLPELDGRGLRVDWQAAAGMPAEALAMVPSSGGVCGATPGVAPAAADSLFAFVEANAVEIAAGTFVVAGLVVGGLALGGEFDDDDDDAPASPSR